MVGQSSERRTEQEVKKPRAASMPMPREYMLQMTCMMVMGNLYNSSPGRHPQISAKFAMDAAIALAAAYEKHLEKDKRNAHLVMPMPRDYMLQMTSMMVMANLYNSSLGRHPTVSAKCSMDAAIAATAVFEKFFEKEKKNAHI